MSAKIVLPLNLMVTKTKIVPGLLSGAEEIEEKNAKVYNQILNQVQAYQ